MNLNKEDLRYSIITVNKNNLDGLKTTLESVFNQRGDVKFEIIVIDANSNDGTKYYLETIKDNRLTWISENDDGIFDGMNKGINISKGNYIYFLNSGDKFSSNIVLSEVNKHISNQDIVSGHVRTYLNGNLLGRANVEPWIVHQSAFINRRLHKKYFYDKSFRIFGDLDLWTRLKLHNKFNPHFVDIDIADMEMDGVGTNPKFLYLRKKDKIRYNLKHKRYFSLISDYVFLSFMMLIFNILGHNGYNILNATCKSIKLMFIKLASRSSPSQNSILN